MAEGDFNNLLRRKNSEKALLYKAFNLAKSPKYDRCQQDLASVVYNFFHEKTFPTCARSKNSATQNKFTGSNTWCC